MHKWLQLPATPTDDPLATVYPINQYKKSHVYAVTRINPIYVDEEQHRHHETWNNNNNNNNNNNKSGSSGYESQPHSDHSSLDKGSPPATKSDRSSSGGSSSGGGGHRTAAPWLSPIKEGVIDARQYCIPRPVWPGRDDGRAVEYITGGGVGTTVSAAADRIPRAKCCRHCVRCRCRGGGGGGGRHGTTTTSSSSASSTSDGGGKAVRAVGRDNGGGYSGECSSSAYDGTISTGSGASTIVSGVGGCGGSCSDDAHPTSSSGITGSVGSADLLRKPLHVLDPRFCGGVHRTVLDDNWSSVDLRLNQKTDNLQYDCGAMLRGLQFTLDAQQAEKLMQKIKVGKKHRCWCRFVTALLGLIMFLVSVITVSLTLSRGQKMFGPL